MDQNSCGLLVAALVLQEVVPDLLGVRRTQTRAKDLFRDGRETQLLKIGQTLRNRLSGTDVPRMAPCGWIGNNMPHVGCITVD